MFWIDGGYDGNSRQTCGAQTRSQCSWYAGERTIRPKETTNGVLWTRFGLQVTNARRRRCSDKSVPNPDEHWLLCCENIRYTESVAVRSV